MPRENLLRESFDLQQKLGQVLSKAEGDKYTAGEVALDFYKFLTSVAFGCGRTTVGAVAIDWLSGVCCVHPVCGNFAGMQGGGAWWPESVVAAAGSEFTEKCRVDLSGQPRSNGLVQLTAFSIAWPLLHDPSQVTYHVATNKSWEGGVLVKPTDAKTGLICLLPLSFYGGELWPIEKYNRVVMFAAVGVLEADHYPKCVFSDDRYVWQMSEETIKQRIGFLAQGLVRVRGIA